MKNILGIIRLVVYVTTIIIVYVWSIEAIESTSLCFTYSNHGIICPTCGVTRAFVNLMHFRFARAYAYNSIFTIAIAPISVIIIIQDAYIIIQRLFFKKEKLSLLEFFFVGFLK